MKRGRKYVYSENTQVLHNYRQAHQDSSVAERSNLRFMMLAEPNPAGGLLRKTA